MQRAQRQVLAHERPQLEAYQRMLPMSGAHVLSAAKKPPGAAGAAFHNCAVYPTTTP